jgi:hypothetical protein
MKIVTMDDEAADLMHAGMEMAHAALEARSRRVDPEGIISNSFGMSKVKTRDIMRQLNAPPLCEFHELNPKDRHLVMTLAAALLAEETAEMRNVIWRKFRLVVFQRSPVQPDLIEGATIDNPSQEELRVSKAATKAKKQARAVRPLSEGQGEGNTP